MFLRKFHDDGHQDGRYRKYDECNQRHQRRYGQHHHDDTDNGRCRSDNLRHTLVQSLPKGIHIVGNPGQYFTISSALKILHRHAVDLLGYFLAHAITDFLRHAGHNPALNEGKCGAGQIKRQCK